MSATTATRTVTTTPAQVLLRSGKPRSGRSVATGTAARLGDARPRLRIVADGEQAPVITRVAPLSLVEPAAPLRRVHLDEFFAPEAGGESQTLVVVPPARLTRRGRVVVVGLALAVSLGVGVLWASGSAAGDHPLQTSVVTVHTGDTLWDVASAATPAGGDIRSTVSRISDLNHLDSSVVQAGQHLRVPVS